MNRDVIRGLASVITRCWNQFEFTRQCIDALVRHTRRQWELIVVDNGSTDGTAIYLAGVHDAAAVPVTMISNCENRGSRAAINQGLAAARGEYLVNAPTAKDAKNAKEERTEVEPRPFRK